jgi:hypothetical protein
MNKDKRRQFDIEKEVHLLMANMKKYTYDKCDYKKKIYVVDEILAGYSLSKLMKIAALLDKFSFPGVYYPERDMNAMLKQVLIERKKRLNKDFEWTEENKARFLMINDRLYNACVKGWKEATDTAAVLEKRINKRDSLLKDY